MEKINELILIVDDEPNIRETAAFILETEGYQVIKACNGEEGLDQVKQLRPRVVLLDVMMPKMDGYTLCKKIKQDPELKDTFVIMLTAKGQKVDEQHAILMGADAYMTKPFDAEEIMWYIQKMFNLARDSERVDQNEI